MTQNVFPWLQTIRLHDFTLKGTLSVHPSSMTEERNARQADHSLYLVPALTASSSSRVTFTAATPLLSSPRTGDHAGCPHRYNDLHAPPSKCHWMMNWR